MALNCTVKCLSQITLLKHTITLISLLGGGYTHPKVTPHGLKTKSYLLLISLNLVLKTIQTPHEHSSSAPNFYCFSHGFLHLEVDWHTYLGLAHVPKHPTVGCNLGKVNQSEASCKLCLYFMLLAKRQANTNFRLSNENSASILLVLSLISSRLMCNNH